ncbi:restriction endonuclease subunit S [Flavobacterium sp. GNP002]
METVQPKLRFPEFEGNMNYSYKKHSFGDVFLFSTGKNIKQNEASPEFETLCVRYGELYHMYNEVIKVVINRTNLDKSELIFSQGDEILLPSAGEDPLDIGSASALTVENVAIGRTINILKPLKQNVYSNIYAAYYINHKLRSKIATLAKGVSISNVYNSDLKTLEIILPKLEEQTRIANFLSLVDEKLNLLKEKKELLEDYKKGIMQKIFNQEIRFKDDNGEDFEEWEEKSLGSLCKITTGKLDANAMVEDGVYRFYTCAKDYYRIDKYAFDTEALLISGNGANVGYIHYYKGKFNAYQRTYILDGFNENIMYVKYFLQMNLPKRIKGEKNDGNTPYIVLSTLSEMDFLIPSIEEQTKIANFLSAIDEKIELVSNQIQDTQEYKKGLLQQLFV